MTHWATRWFAFSNEPLFCFVFYIFTFQYADLTQPSQEIDRSEKMYRERVTAHEMEKKPRSLGEKVKRACSFKPSDFWQNHSSKGSLPHINAPSLSAGRSVCKAECKKWLIISSAGGKGKYLKIVKIRQGRAKREWKKSTMSKSGNGTRCWSTRRRTIRTVSHKE